MSTWILADTHLDHTGEKPMSVFGPVWNNHEEVLAANWKALITPEDTVIIAGDISWAMTAREAIPDLQYLDQLPGKRKILLKGNHDFWWSTRSKTENIFKNHDFKTLEIIQNEAKLIKDATNPEDDFFLVGTRGWKLPSDQEADAKDKKVYQRELQRFQLSLADIERVKKAEAETRDLPIIAIFHYPPLNKFAHNTEMTELIEENGINRVYYGHVHKQYGRDEVLCFQGVHNGLDYQNVALDYIECVPVKVEIARTAKLRED